MRGIKKFLAWKEEKMAESGGEDLESRIALEIAAMQPPLAANQLTAIKQLKMADQIDFLRALARLRAERELTRLRAEGRKLN